MDFCQDFAIYSGRVFSFATIRGLRVYFATIWDICHWEKNGLILPWLDPPWVTQWSAPWVLD